MSDSEAELVKGSAAVVGLECINSTCGLVYADEPCQWVIGLPPHCRQIIVLDETKFGMCFDPGWYSEEMCREWDIKCYEEMHDVVGEDGLCPQQCGRPVAEGNNARNCDSAVEV